MTSCNLRLVYIQKYKNIINENLTDEMFSKEKEKEATIYKLQLTKKQYNDILAKILETMKNDDVVLNRITAMYGQQNNSAKDSVIKMYQENLDEEIKDTFIINKKNTLI